MENRRRKKRRKVHRRGRNKGNWFSRMGTLGKSLVCLGGVLICFIVAAAIFVYAKLEKLNTEDIPEKNIVINDTQEVIGEGYTNFALFGVDSREGDLDLGTRTDCIIIASLNNKTKEIKMASVYRDTLLDLSEGTLEKCNAAYSYGGPEQAINMMNKNLDLDIQDFVTVDFGAIADIIDLLGGVEIDVKPEEIQYLNEFVYETGQVANKEANFVLEPGMQTLDGVQATTYARIRSTEGGDFVRSERQRYVIEKMVEKIMKSKLSTINKIVDKVLPKIKTSLSATEILSYAKSFAKYKLGANMGFPEDQTTDTIPGKGNVIIPVSLEDNVKKLHAFLFGEDSFMPSETVKSVSSKIENLVGPRLPDNYEIPKVGEHDTTTDYTQEFEDGIDR